jgi:hypothetical protein
MGVIQCTVGEPWNWIFLFAAPDGPVAVGFLRILLAEHVLT